MRLLLLLAIGALASGCNDAHAGGMWWLKKNSGRGTGGAPPPPDFTFLESGTFAALIGTGGDIVADDEDETALTVARNSVKFCSAGSTDLNELAVNLPCVESAGLSLEGSFENLAQRSEEHDNAFWSKLNLTVPTTNAADPLGGTTADTVNVGTNTGTHRYARGNVSFTSGTRYALAVYAKDEGPDFIQIEMNDSVGTFALTQCNLALGTVTASDGTGGQHSISAEPGGFYRCGLAWTADTTSSSGTFVTIRTCTLTGNCTSGYAGASETQTVWGTVWGVSRHVPSYVRTAGATATRVGEVAQYTIPESITEAAHCFGATVTNMDNSWDSGAERVIYRSSDFGDPDTFSLYLDTSGKLTWDVYDSSSGLKRIQGGSALTTGERRVVACNNHGSLTLTVGGTAHGSASGSGTGVMSSMPATLYVGAAADGTSNLNGWGKDLCFTANPAGCL